MCCFEFIGKLSLPASPLFSIALCFLIVSHRWQIIPRIFRGFSMASIVFPISHHSVHYADNFPCSSPSHPPFFPVFFQRISWLNLRWAQLYVSLVSVLFVNYLALPPIHLPSPSLFNCFLHLIVYSLHHLMSLLLFALHLIFTILPPTWIAQSGGLTQPIVRSDGFETISFWKSTTIPLIGI